MQPNLNESLHYRYFVGSGSVLTTTTKDTSDLKPLQIGFFDSRNYKAIAAGTGKNKVPEIIVAMGSPNASSKVEWTNATHSIKSVPIRADKLISYRKSAPKKAKQHKVSIGWDGTTDCKNISVECGETYGLFVQVEGSPASRYFAGKPLAEVFTYTTPCCDGDVSATTDVEKMIDSFVTQVNTHPNISPFVKAEKLVSYATPPTYDTLDYTKYELTVADGGGIVDLAKIQVAYPDYDVVRASRSGIYSTYEMIVLTSDGAPDDYVIGESQSVVTGCDECPSGYTLTGESTTYKFKIVRADAGTSANLATVKTDYTEELDQSTIVRTVFANGVSTYIGYGSSATTPLTQGATSGDDVTLIGYREPYCVNDENIVVTWEETGSLYKISRDLCLVLGDDDCDDVSGTGQLAAIIAYYAENDDVVADSIALDNNGTCANSYTISQWSKNLIEDGCGTGIAEFDELQPYNGFYWTTCPCDSATINDVDNIGIVLTGAYINTEFGDCSFEYSDYVDLDLPKIIVRGGKALDDLGLCSADQLWDVTELQKPQYPSGTGENVKRNYIQASKLLHQIYTDDKRMQEVYGFNYDFINRKKFYKFYYLEFEALDKHNKNTGFGGNDIRTTITFAFEEGVDTSAFEAVLEGWITSARPDLTDGLDDINLSR